MVRKVVGGLLGATIVGLFVAVPFGQGREISVDLWLVAVSVWLAWILVSQALTAAPLVPARLRGAWQWRRRKGNNSDGRPRQLQALEGLVLSARDNDRAHALRLRPRLTEIANHYLRTRCGIDPTTSPERARALLGESAWLLDEQAEARRPQLAEIDALLDIVLGSRSSRGDHV